MTIRKRSSVSTPIQGYQNNPNEMLYRMRWLSGTETREKQSKKAKEERNSHEAKRTQTNKNDNTKPIRLIHAHPRPPRRSTLNSASIDAFDQQKQAWDGIGMTKRKTDKTDQKLTLASSDLITLPQSQSYSTQTALVPSTFDI